MRAPLHAVRVAACFALALAGNSLMANESLALNPGMSAAVQTPAVPPFTALGDTRLEIRLHNWSVPASDATVFWNAGFRVQLRASAEVCVSDEMDELPAYGGTMCADIAGQHDITIRAERDLTKNELRLEAFASAHNWSAAPYCGTKQNGTNVNTFSCPIGTAHLNSWAGVGGLGDGAVNVRLSWMKWYSFLAPADGALGEDTPADLADWRFEGSMANQGTGKYAVGIGPLQPMPAAAEGGVTAVIYMPSPAAPPACVAGSPRTFRAGSAAQLDGAGSYPLDGGAGLSYSWRQVSGPSAAGLSGATAAQPAVTGLVFGSYVFELTVTDSSGVSSACTVKHGAVASDENGAVVTNNSAVDALLGPMIGFGANPWPWFDDRHKAAADLQIAGLDAYYGAYWDPASPAYGSAAARDAWQYNAAPANYYDNVAAFYALYYRSGIDDYRDAARNLADRFWASPMVNSGANCDAWAGMTSCYPARSLSVLGLVLRALDGRPDMWPGLRTIFNSYRTYYLDVADPAWGMWDIREMAYHLAVVSYCALADPDAARRQECKTSIGASFAKVWTPARAADGSFPMLFRKTSSWDTGSGASLSNGSRTVTGMGTKWDAGAFQCANAAGNLYPCKVWFTNNAAAAPSSNAEGDAGVYTATVVDATHLTLDRPYEGASGVHGWALPDANAGLVGYGAQPFIQGILGVAFHLAGLAIADTDPHNSALAESYNVGIANWIRNNGYWSATKGMYFGAGFMNCQAPISDTDVFCTGGNSAGEARVLNAESLRSIMTAYAYSGDPALKAFGDTLYSAMFSKPGTGGPNPDGSYIDALNDGNGWYMIGVPPIGKAPKYFGMFFGFGALSGWPAYRAGSAQAQTGGASSSGSSVPPGHGGMRPRMF
jgi:hypothetical protein